MNEENKNTNQIFLDSVHGLAESMILRLKEEADEYHEDFIKGILFSIKQFRGMIFTEMEDNDHESPLAALISLCAKMDKIEAIYMTIQNVRDSRKEESV